MNLSTIRTEVRQELQETSAIYWTDAELNQYINDGVLLIQQLTQWYEDTAIIPLVAAQQNYALPSNNMTLRRVTYNGRFLPQTNHWELDRDNPSWREAANSDNIIRFFLPQWDTIATYPPPATSGITYSFTAEVGVTVSIEDSGTPASDWIFDSEVGVIIAIEDSEGGQWVFEADTITDPFTSTSPELGIIIDLDVDEGNLGLFYSALPDTMANDTDSPQLHACAHPAIVPYTVYRAFARMGPHQDLRLAKSYFMDFADWMERIMKIRDIQFPERVLSWEGVAKGTMFENRLSSIGPPIMQDLLPSYPQFQ